MFLLRELLRNEHLRKHCRQFLDVDQAMDSRNNWNA